MNIEISSVLFTMLMVIYYLNSCRMSIFNYNYKLERDLSDLSQLICKHNPKQSSLSRNSQFHSKTEMNCKGSEIVKVNFVKGTTWCQSLV